MTFISLPVVTIKVWMRGKCLEQGLTCYERTMNVSCGHPVWQPTRLCAAHEWLHSTSICKCVYTLIISYYSRLEPWSPWSWHTQPLTCQLSSCWPPDSDSDLFRHTEVASVILPPRAQGSSFLCHSYLSGCFYVCFYFPYLIPYHLSFPGCAAEFVNCA